MTRFSQGTGINSKELLDRAVRGVVVEALEQRQYMTGSLDLELAALEVGFCPWQPTAAPREPHKQTALRLSTQ